MLKLINKISKLKKELDKINIQTLVGKKVKITKKYVDWIKENGERCGLPESEINFIYTRPMGKIVNINLNMLTPEHSDFTVYFDDFGKMTLSYDSISLVKENN